MVVACRSFSPAAFAHVTGINSSGYERERVSRAGYFIRRIKLRPMSSICFFAQLFLSLLLLSPLFVRTPPFSLGSRGFMAPRTENVPVCRCSFSFSLGRLVTHTCGVLSRSCTRASWIQRASRCSLGAVPSPRPPFASSRYLGTCTMQYCASLKKVLSRFSFAFCIYLRCFACRYDCSDKICAMCDAVYFGCLILYAMHSLFLCFSF